MHFCKRFGKWFFGGLGLALVGLFFLVILCVSFILTATQKNKYEDQAHAFKIDQNSYFNSDGTLLYNPIYHFNVSNETYSCNLTS